MLTKDFVLAGKAVFTLELPAEYAEKHTLRPHYTFKVRFKKGDGQYQDAYFVSLLTGPDNYTNYSYLGMLDKDSGRVRATAKSALPADHLAFQLLNRALLRVWEGKPEALEAHGFKLHHEGKCGRCGRRLTVPQSIESGIGPECIKHVFGPVPKLHVHEDDEPDHEPDPANEAEDRALRQAHLYVPPTGPGPYDQGY